MKTRSGIIKRGLLASVTTIGLVLGLAVAAPTAAQAAGNRTVSGTISFPAEISVPERSNIQVTVSKNTGPLQDYRPGSAGFSYNPGTGAWSVSGLDAAVQSVYIYFFTPGQQAMFYVGGHYDVDLRNGDVSGLSTAAPAAGALGLAITSTPSKPGKPYNIVYARNTATNVDVRVYANSGDIAPDDSWIMGNYNLEAPPASYTLRVQMTNGVTVYYDGTPDGTVTPGNAQAVPISYLQFTKLASLDVRPWEQGIPKITPATPTISGTAKVGQTLTANPGAWQPAGVTLAYQWKRNNAAIAGANGTQYIVTPDDVGRKITVTVTGTKAEHTSASRTSAAKTIPTTFADVPRGHAFYDDIQWMYDTGITTGSQGSNGLVYQPNGGVTRGQMAAFLYRFSAPDGYTAPSVSPFGDVPTSHQFYREISWMREAGITTGMASPTGRVYSPNGTVTREQMAAFLARLLADESYAAPSTTRFADVPKTNPFFRDISWMYDSGVSTGSPGANGKSYYSPAGTVTRGQMAAFLHRASAIG